MEASLERTTLSYILRDHDRAKFEHRKEVFAAAAEYLKQKYGEKALDYQVKDQYYNMRMQLEPVMHGIDLAREAMQAAGVQPQVKAIRGGTDGARLSFMGLPCPNLFTGGHNFHGRFEYAVVDTMEKAVRTIVEIVRLSGEKTGK